MIDVSYRGTFTKLPSGNWGLLVEAAEKPIIGARVECLRRDGSRVSKYIGKVLREDIPPKWLCTIDDIDDEDWRTT